MDEKLNWNCEMEVNLFHALRGHKPAGVNRHFHMLSIHEKMSSSYKKITPKQIWEYLNELYDLRALNESEIIPFPNREVEFSLPEAEYAELMEKSTPRQSLSKSDSDKQEKAEKGDKPERLAKDEKEEKLDTGSLKALKTEAKLPVLTTPDNSPKRKRTRHTPSTASPATPDAPPHKRRR